MVKGHYITGVDGHSKTYDFRDDEEWFEWDKKVRDIKFEILMINETVEATVRTPFYLCWRKHVLALKQRFGGDRIPIDIQEALTSVENGVGVPVTKW